MAQASDQELARRTLAGDEAAFAEIYRRHAPTLLVRLRRILGHDSEAEDVLQVVFLKLHEKLHRYDGRRPLGAWLHGFAFNIVTRQLRARRRRWWLSFGQERAVGWTPDRATRSPEARLSDDERAREIYEAMELLPAKKRIAFALHELEDLGLTEIGELVGASPQTVRARVMSAREELQKRLGATPRRQAKAPAPALREEEP